MIRKEIGKIFDFIPETNLTEESIYIRQGFYPVYSGKTEEGGIVAKINTYNQDLPCITFTTYGIGAGKLYYREGKYTIGRNCMGLRPKEEYKARINPKWFAFHFQNLFYKLRIGDPKGQRSLNKMLLERIEIEIPELKVQERQLDKYKQLYTLKISIGEAPSILSDSVRRVHMPYQGHYEIKELKKIFHMKGGNSGLTEYFIYYNQPSNNEEEMIEIFSSATLEAKRMGYISRNAKPNGKKLKIFSGPAILVARNGYAGSMTHISSGEFTTNDHAYVLTPKKDWKDKINLKWFIHEYQDLFFNLVTSKSDNATFDKGYASRQTVKIPDRDFQNAFVGKIEYMESIIAKLREIEKESDALLECTIV